MRSPRVIGKTRRVPGPGAVGLSAVMAAKVAGATPAGRNRISHSNPVRAGHALTDNGARAASEQSCRLFTANDFSEKIVGVKPGGFAIDSGTAPETIAKAADNATRVSSIAASN